MKPTFKEVETALKALELRFEELPADQKQAVLRNDQFKKLYAGVRDKSEEERATYGQEINALKAHFQQKIDALADQEEELDPIDVTAPFDLNQSGPASFISPELGSVHPLMQAQDEMMSIFARMGFEAVESRLLDNQYYMFDSLNFPAGHPARDEYDTFLLDENDADGNPLVAPSHTSIMQNRIIKQQKDKLEQGEPIAVVVPGRVFRNEDTDARHEHTFYQIEGIYVGKDITTAHLIATLKEFMVEYYQKEVEIKTQPFYFPFTEPSFEFAISCPFCDKQGCKVCGEGWIELLGCGMIHPNVLRDAGVDPEVYTGFAWGVGFMRMLMIKHEIEDVRHFQSGKLDFLRQFS